MRPRSRVPRGALVASGAVVLVVAGIAGYLGFGCSPCVPESNRGPANNKLLLPGWRR
jgi:hypothetical protein